MKRFLLKTNRKNNHFQGLSRIVGMLLILLSQKGFSQAPTITWDKTIGSSSTENAGSLIKTSDGGYLLGGDFYGSNAANRDRTQNGWDTGNNLYEDYWVVKLDAAGNKVWDRVLGSSLTDIGGYVCQTTDGGYIVGGTSNGAVNGDKTTPNKGNGNNDYWIVKLDASGNKLWDQTFGSTSHDNLKSIMATSDGGCILGGVSSGTASGDKSVGTKGSADYWVVKVSSSGTKQWDKTYGGSLSDQLIKVIQTSDGGYLFGGYTLSFATGDKTESSRGSNDYWVVKADANGDKQWDKRFGGDADDFLTSLTETTDGGFVLIGNIEGTSTGGDVTDTHVSTTFPDAWIVKISSSGTKVWDFIYGGSRDEDEADIITTSDGGFMCLISAGFTEDGDITPSSPLRGGEDYWFLKLNADGTKNWDKIVGSDGSETVVSVVQTTDGGYLAYGRVGSTGGGDQTVNYSSIDLWLVKLGGGLCTLSATATTTAATCSGSGAIANGQLILATNSGGTKAAYSIGSSYSGVDFSSATSIGSLPYTVTSTLTNPTVPQPYTIRVFNSATCYQDYVVVLPPTKCVAADLSVTVSPVTQTGNAGEFLTYTVTLNNAGPDTAGDIQIKVPMPEPKATLLSAQASNGTYNTTTNIWTITSLPVGNATLAFTVKVN